MALGAAAAGHLQIEQTTPTTLRRWSRKMHKEKRTFRMKLSLPAFSLLWAIPAFAADAKVEDPEKDEVLIRGSWRVASVRQEAKELPKVALVQMRFIITESSISFGKVGQEQRGFDYTLDPKKTPKAIDTTHSLGPGKPILQLGIYSLEGETLTLSLAGAGMPRPKSFGEKTATTFILKRVKEPENGRIE